MNGPTLSPILNEVIAERNRQDAFVADGTFPWNCATPGTPNEYKLAVLGEEFGEVCGATLGPLGDQRAPDSDLRKELIQVAAVAVAWVEGIDATTTESAP